MIVIDEQIKKLESIEFTITRRKRGKIITNAYLAFDTEFLKWAEDEAKRLYKGNPSSSKLQKCLRVIRRQKKILSETRLPLRIAIIEALEILEKGQEIKQILARLEKVK